MLEIATPLLQLWEEQPLRKLSSQQVVCISLLSAIVTTRDWAFEGALDFKNAYQGGSLDD